MISRRRMAQASCLIVLGFCLLSRADGPTALAEQVNLALHKPASASSIENEEHNAAQANDGDTETSWCADDEPENGPEWWQVDLEKSVDVLGCEICWPYDGKQYRYKVEGSVDRKAFFLLSDQTHTRSAAQVQNLKFENVKKARFVKITITGFEEGCWASLSEVKIFGR